MRLGSTPSSSAATATMRGADALAELGLAGPDDDPTVAQREPSVELGRARQAARGAGGQLIDDTQRRAGGGQDAGVRAAAAQVLVEGPHDVVAVGRAPTARRAR